MLHYNYTAYTPSYPVYPSGLLLLTRYNNARYARLDVPDWDFRPRPGLSSRSDPSGGAISRTRSVVRIKTRVGKTTPGARLVEKFIIREPGSSSTLGNLGRPPTEAPNDRGFAKNAGARVSGIGESSAVGRTTVQVTKPEEESQEESTSLEECPPALSTKKPLTPQEIQNTEPTSPKTTNNQLPHQNDDFGNLSTEDTSNSTEDSSKSPKTAKKKLKNYAKSKKTDLLKRVENQKDSNRDDEVISDCELVIIDSFEKVESASVKLFESPDLQNSIEVSTVREENDDLKENREGVPKLLNFTAQVPLGVQKVQPIKPFSEFKPVSSDNVNCVSDAKVENRINAKCYEAKSATKSRPGVTDSIIEVEGNSNKLIEEENLDNNSCINEPCSGINSKKDISSVELKLDSKIVEDSQKTEICLDSSLFEGVENFENTEEKTENLIGFNKTINVVGLSQKSNISKSDDVDIRFEATEGSSLINGTTTANSEQPSVKFDENKSESKLANGYLKRKTVEPVKVNDLVGSNYQTRSSTGNFFESAKPLTKSHNTERLDRDNPRLEIKGEELRLKDREQIVNLSTVVPQEDPVSAEAKFGGEEDSLNVGDANGEKNSVVKLDSESGVNGVLDARKNDVNEKSVTNGAVKKVGEVKGDKTKVVKKKVVKKKSNKENKVDDSKALCLRNLDDLKGLYDDYRVVGSDVRSEDLEIGWELIDVIVDMEGSKKKKKVIVKKKGSKVKVTPLEAKPPMNATSTGTDASPGDIMRQLSKKRVSLADEDLNLVGFNPDKRVSITDDVLVEEAALFDKMINRELKEARKSSLAFPPIFEEKSQVDTELEEIAASKAVAKTPTPKRVVPSPQERRELWKKNALRKSMKSLGGFYKPRAPPPESSSSSESECDVNCHQKCMELMPNLCGVNQKLMVEALLNVRRGRRSASGTHSRKSLFKMDSESDESQTDGGRVAPQPPAKTLPRFRTYTINDFQFLKVLGKGSFGKVLLAELKGSQCYYAVKCLKKDVVLEDDDVECTMIERKVLALGTGHPYFCHLFCTFQTESHLFFVMEYLNGGDLMFHIQQSGRFDEGRARFYAAEIVTALSFLHKHGIVYRDLKLDNVLLDFDGHVRIADFGMCKLQIYLDRTTDTFCGTPDYMAPEIRTSDSFCGTPDYMAPEIIKGLKYNQCVDWWSFGILLYEMLVGQSPFSGCDEDHLFWSICNERPHMPRHLSQPAMSVLRDLLEKDWTKRLGSSDFGSQAVMGHQFFDGLKWHLLERRQVDPPYKPTTKHPLDTKYFDTAFTREKPILTPVDKAILESMDQSQFEGFSYTNPNVTE